MRDVGIQNAIEHGVPPFALCRIVSKHIRARHKRGDSIQDLMDAAFKSLSQPSFPVIRYTLAPGAECKSDHVSKINPKSGGN